MYMLSRYVSGSKTRPLMDSLYQFLATAVFGFLVLLFLLYYHLSWKPFTKSEGRTQKAPEADGAWPLIGHLHLLGEPGLPHKTLGAMADKYGSAFTIRIGMHRAIVVNTWELAKECFTTNDKVFLNRPKGLAMKELAYNYAGFGFAPYGPYWRQIRKIASLELLSTQRLEMLKRIRVSEIETLIKDLYQIWVKNNKDGAVLVEMKQFLGDLTLNLSVKMIVGKSMSENGEEETRRFKKVMREFFKFTGLFVLSDAIPLLGWWDLQGYEREMKRTFKELDGLFQGWLDEHKEKGRLQGEGGRDFMDVLSSILEKESISGCGYDADTINKSTCQALVLGASDTTMITLTWALSLLMNNHYALKKAQEELEIQVGKDRNVEESDIPNLQYLQAIVKESLRLYPPGPLSGPREAIEDCTVGDYHVPAGTRLIVNLWKIQRDPRVWSDPSEFRPERFLTSHAHVDVKGQNFELMPFGSGRRACPGTLFALQVLHLTLAQLLHGFEFKVPFDAAVDMSESPGLTNVKATPLELLLTPRLPSKLYMGIETKIS